MMSVGSRHTFVFLFWLALVLGLTGALYKVARADDAATPVTLSETEQWLDRGFSSLNRLGHSVNAGGGGEVALDEVCRIGSSLGAARLNKYWDGAQGLGFDSTLGNTPLGGVRFGAVKSWLASAARSRISLDQLCARLQSGGAGFDAQSEFTDLKSMIRDGAINALAGEGLAFARNSNLPYLRGIEVEGGFTGGDPSFSVTTIQPLLENHDKGHFIFNQLSWQHEGGTDHPDGDPDDTVNAGIAYRALLREKTLLVGANLFFDHELDQNHNRISFGVDAQTTLYGLSANRYIPLTKWKGIDSVYEERALSGWDLELSGRVPEYPDWAGYLRGFTWDSVDGKDDIYGYEANLEWSPVPGLVFVGGVIDDNDSDPEVQASIRLRLNFNEPTALQFTPRAGLEPVADRVFDKVRRENTIRTQIRKRAETLLTVIQTIGANTANTDEGVLTLYDGLTFNMPAVVNVANTPGAVGRIRLVDGGVLTLGLGSSARIEPGLLTLIAGSAQYVSGATNVIVNVPGATVTLLGTDIDMVTNGVDSTLRVRDGSVRMVGNASGSSTIVANNMGQAISGVIGGVPFGSPVYETHADIVSAQIDRVGSEQTETKVAPYPHELPRITTGGASVGNTIVLAQKFTKPIVVSGGTPRMMLTINGVNRNAVLTGGSGTDTLSFSYTLVAGDAGASTVIVRGIDPNGATVAGTDGKLAVTTFADVSLALSGAGSDTTPPAGYAVAFVTSPVNDGNHSAIAFDITSAEVGSTYNYTISSSGGGTAVTGSGIASAATTNVTGVNVSGLNGGTLTLSLTLTDLAGNAGTATTATVTKISGATMSLNFLTQNYMLNGETRTTIPALMTLAGGAYTRTTRATYFDSTGTLQTALPNVPRFDHDPVTLQPKGFLIETISANYIQNSQFSGINNAVYTTSTTVGRWRFSIPPGHTTSIVGTGVVKGMNYVDVRFQSTNSSGATVYPTFVMQYADTPTVTSGTYSVASAWTQTLAYSASPIACNISLENRSLTSAGAYVTATSVSLPRVVSDLAYRVTPTLQHGATAGRAETLLQFAVPTGTTCSTTIRFAAPQLELSPFVTSYIPTTSAVGNRAHDIFSLPVNSNWYNQSAGSAYQNVSWITGGTGNYPMFWRFDNTANVNGLRWNFYYSQPSGALGVDSYNGGTNQGTFNHTIGTTGSIKMAAAVSLNNANAAFGGSLKALDTSWTPPIVTTFTVPHGNASRWIKEFRYYPNRLPDATLQAMSAP